LNQASNKIKQKAKIDSGCPAPILECLQQWADRTWSMFCLNNWIKLATKSSRRPRSTLAAQHLSWNVYNNAN